MPELKEEEPPAPDMPPLNTVMDASPYLAGPEDMPPPIEEPKLVKPENVKSRFWAHFMKYNLEFHPDKKTTARCSLCGKDISVKQGTGGLKNHLKFKHPQENALLFDQDNEQIALAMNASILYPSSTTTAIGSPSRGGTATAMPAKKKPRHGGDRSIDYSDLNLRMDASKRNNEKHLMEMWSLTRCELRELRKELKVEEDEDVIRELEGDVRALKKRKVDFAEMLGFPKDEEESTVATENV
mmetsp:Transcript_8916/g.20030  ORF Transcript_8916/g.20030 Transcript_8916/m.20030 type:complete len:241 (-) Transcript_8916:145-867(-)|eukprot:CAMPEP_0172321930 /NCGR_PEP_ID=MMETSP1058-20130122/44681_1 /TAXON_ID=83371 /ORGANISM="Detonula confervacea, Strain CCMP 353" /LENGTH=240 /DNA_ID=CAMNT_0013037555 /DNA_START=30 /DNA_END=752 /DNA_ORIENTATION=+